jgi:hypothetical protein
VPILRARNSCGSQYVESDTLSIVHPFTEKTEEEGQEYIVFAEKVLFHTTCKHFTYKEAIFECSDHLHF